MLECFVMYNHIMTRFIRVTAISYILALAGFYLFYFLNENIANATIKRLSLSVDSTQTWQFALYGGLLFLLISTIKQILYVFFYIRLSKNDTTTIVRKLLLYLIVTLTYAYLYLHLMNLYTILINFDVNKLGFTTPQIIPYFLLEYVVLAGLTLLIDYHRPTL